MTRTRQAICAINAAVELVGKRLGRIGASPRGRVLLIAGAALAFAVLFWGVYLTRRQGPDLRWDAYQYLRLGFNLQRHGVFSGSAPGMEDPVPTSHRGPGYPFVLSLMLATSREIRNATPERYMSEEFQPHFVRVVHAHFILLFLLSLVSAALVFVITRSWAAACASTFLVGFDRDLWMFGHMIYSEVFVALTIALLSLALFLCVVRRAVIWHVVAGLLLAALSLTRAHFQYFLPVVFVFLLVHAWRNSPRWRRDIPALCALVLIPLAAAQGWKARNYAHFDRWYTANRGGVCLDIRARFNTGTARQMVACAFYYSRSGRLRMILEKHFDYLEYRPFVRHAENTESHWAYATRRRTELSRRYRSGVRSDQVQLEEAKAKIKAHPVQHLLWCMPLAIRGLAVKNRFSLSLLLFGCLLGLFTASLLRRRPDILAVLLPSVYSYAFYTAITHNKHRYNIPLLPILYVAVVIVAWLALRRARRALRAWGGEDQQDGASPMQS